jgi:Leucine-rich repeat (LRR) protein
LICQSQIIQKIMEIHKRINEYIQQKEVSNLDLSRLNLLELPKNLPSLQELYCSYDQLTKLPENLLVLRILFCHNNKY